MLDDSDTRVVMPWIVLLCYCRTRRRTGSGSGPGVHQFSVDCRTTNGYDVNGGDVPLTTAHRNSVRPSVSHGSGALDVSMSYTTMDMPEAATIAPNNARQ